MTTERAVVLVKKVIYFEEFGYLNSSCIRKSLILMFLSSWSDKFTLICSKTQLGMFMLVSGRRIGAQSGCREPALRLHTNLYKSG